MITNLFRKSLLGTVVLWSCWQGLAADPLSALAPRFSGTAEHLNACAFGNGLYVAVGDAGTLLTSTDTVTWVPRNSGMTNRLSGVTYGTNGFLLVGESTPGGRSPLLTSADGLTWTQQTSPVTNDLSAVCYGFGRYVAVGTKGVILTSSNLQTWSIVNTGAPYTLNGVYAQGAYADGQVQNTFVAVGDAGTILTSPDGLAWTARFSGIFARLRGVAAYREYTGSWVAVGDSGTLATSTDTVTWTVQSSGTASDLYAVAADSRGGFGAVGKEGVFIVQPPGQAWASQPSGTANDLRGLLCANGNFLAVGYSGVIEAGAGWVAQTCPLSQPLSGVAFGNGRFVASAGNTLLASTNGIDWQTAFLDNALALASIASDGSRFVAAGGSTIVTSSNGLDWVKWDAGAANTLQQVACGGGVYLAFGYTFVLTPRPHTEGVTFRSRDGVNWSPIPYPPLGFNSIAYGTNTFVAVGLNGAVATSPDGDGWVSRNSGVTVSLSSVAYGNGLFVAQNGATSPDGTNWTARTLSATHSFGPMVYGDRGFLAFGSDANFFSVWGSSPDGLSWTPRGIDLGVGPAEPGVGSVAYGNGTYVAVGNKQIRTLLPANLPARPLLSGCVTSQGFKLSAIAEPGYDYCIQSTPSLQANTWTDLATFASTQALTTVIAPVSSERPQGFYRINRR